MNKKNLLYWICTIILFSACNDDTDTLFTLLPANHTGIHFQNKIADSDSLNILDYLYYYNGGGVAIGDVNNDGLADIYFSSNLGSNKLYLNKGSFKFEDITDKAGVQGRGNWKTGVTIVDVNGDGLLDIYVNEVGKYKNLQGRNELFINNGFSPTASVKDSGSVTFTERAHEYGLDAEGFNTQSVFFDYDHDGDLDMFLVNHSVHSTETYVNAAARTVKNEVGGDKLFRNDSNHFTEVTEQAHIFSSIIGYGLNAVVGDMNNDGWDDIYVSNDFHENDYYYVNQKNGTFREMNATAFGHESRFSMGSDIADINNDGWLDLITLDMLPANEKLLKSSSGDDAPDIFDYKLSFGYHYQYSRNCVQINNGGGKRFSDIALYAGVAATDWSWSPLAADFDNDGIKDLFVTNGILRRPNDLDYLKYISAEYYGPAQPKIKALEAITKMPDGKSSNYIFKGTDSLKFADKTIDWGLGKLSYSNGSAYADLDNDGDLDLVVNNINDQAFIYRNNTIKKTKNHFLQVDVKAGNNYLFAMGAKVLVKHKNTMQLGFVNTSKGFESSSLQYVHFGLGDLNTIDTLQIIWPDGIIKTMLNVKADQLITVNHPETTGLENSLLPQAPPGHPSILFTDITDSVNLPFAHREDNYNDFNSQAFIPHEVSTQGPKMAVADVNKDGMDDFFICGAAGQSGKLFIQVPGGRFKSTNDILFAADSLYEDVNALFFDANNDRYPDLYVVSGGNRYEGKSGLLSDRLYINDGKGNFHKTGNLPVMYGNKSVAAAADYDNDGDMDLFVGGRVTTGNYGNIPVSYLLNNNGKGKFSIAENGRAPGLSKIGMVTGAVWTDIDKDGWHELVIVGEWMPVIIFKNEKGNLKNITISAGMGHTTGLWRALHAADINNDGFEDLLVGNLGENSKLQASAQYPLKLFVGDFDNSGSPDQILALAQNGLYYSFLGKEEIEKQLPSLTRKKYLNYSSFAGQTVEQVFGKKLVDQAILYEAAILSSVLLLNNRKGSYTMSKLPYSTQRYPLYTFLTGHFNTDRKNDIITAGNFYGVSPFEGRYDAGFGDVLSVEKNALVSLNQDGFADGEVRDLKLIGTKSGNPILAVARNNNTILFYKFKK